MIPDFRARAIALMSEVFQEEISPDTVELRRDHFPAWDSINHFRLVTELEEELGIVLDDEEAVSLSSLTEVEALLRANEGDGDVGSSAEWAIG